VYCSHSRLSRTTDIIISLYHGHFISLHCEYSRPIVLQPFSPYCIMDILISLHCGYSHVTVMGTFSSLFCEYSRLSVLQPLSSYCTTDIIISLFCEYFHLIALLIFSSQYSAAILVLLYSGYSHLTVLKIFSSHYTTDNLQTLRRRPLADSEATVKICSRICADTRLAVLGSPHSVISDPMTSQA
jgi:hypothetical protein